MFPDREGPATTGPRGAKGMLLSMDIRQSIDADLPAVLDVVRAAFDPEGPGAGDSVAGLIEALHADASLLPELSLVAEDESGITGYVLFTRATVGDDALPAILLAPLAVRPDRQGTGVGSALVDEALMLAAEAGEKVALVLGHPGYYTRLGFLPASLYGVAPPRQVPDEAWMLAELEAGAAGPYEGTARLSPVFDADEYW